MQIFLKEYLILTLHQQYFFILLSVPCFLLPVRIHTFIFPFLPLLSVSSSQSIKASPCEPGAVVTLGQVFCWKAFDVSLALQFAHRTVFAEKSKSILYAKIILSQKKFVSKLSCQNHKLQRIRQ